MSDKSNLNKFHVCSIGIGDGISRKARRGLCRVAVSQRDKGHKFCVIFLAAIALFSCKYRIYVNTEIICPTQKVMVRFANIQGVRMAIERALADKKKYGTSENYTIIRMYKNRSFKIEKIAPEDIVKCRLQEYPLSEYDRKVVDYYFDDEVD